MKSTFFAPKTQLPFLDSPRKIRNEIHLAIQYLTSLRQTVSSHTARRKNPLRQIEFFLGNLT